MLRNSLLICGLLITAATAQGPGKLTSPRIQADSDPTKVMVEAQLPADVIKDLPAGTWPEELGESWLRFALLKKDGPGLPMVGTYQRKDDRLTFRPRYALEPGAVYRATFGKDKTSSADYRVPERAATPPVTVVKILPGVDVLPANHLKFYVYFSGPMRGGKEIFEQICILDANGKLVSDPWLPDELWNDKDQMLIIYIHPGRIKWGLLLREMLGPVLVPGKEYSIVVKGDMLDAQGQKLGKDYVKKFRTTAEQRTRIELSGWKIQAPMAGTVQPLVVEPNRNIDHVCLSKHLTVKNARGQIVEGTMSLGDLGKGEKTWSFIPRARWEAGQYVVDVDPNLEDVAGNTPLRAFDLDLEAPVPPPQSLQLKFQPSPAKDPL